MCIRDRLGKGADVNHRDSNGVTPLMLAVDEGKKDTTGILIEARADCAPNVANLRWTLLEDMARSNCSRC